MTTLTSIATKAQDPFDTGESFDGYWEGWILKTFTRFNPDGSVDLSSLGMSEYGRSANPETLKALWARHGGGMALLRLRQGQPEGHTWNQTDVRPWYLDGEIVEGPEGSTTEDLYTREDLQARYGDLNRALTAFDAGNQRGLVDMMKHAEMTINAARYGDGIYTTETTWWAFVYEFALGALEMLTLGE